MSALWHDTRRVVVRMDDGSEETLIAWRWREGWHCCPPCSDTQPVYATPIDAALAHVRTVGGDRRALEAREALTHAADAEDTITAAIRSREPADG